MNETFLPIYQKVIGTKIYWPGSLMKSKLPYYRDQESSFLQHIVLIVLQWHVTQNSWVKGHQLAWACENKTRQWHTSDYMEESCKVLLNSIKCCNCCYDDWYGFLYVGFATLTTWKQHMTKLYIRTFFKYICWMVIMKNTKKFNNSMYIFFVFHQISLYLKTRVM